MPEVTVLTAVRNGDKYFAETIESIRSQTFQDWEYIIVDDASTDSTQDIIKSYAQKESRIRPVFRHSNGGPFVAANQGLKMARGNFIVRSDADDISLPERITRQLKFLKESSNIRACVSFGLLIDERSQPTGYKFRYPVLPGGLKWFLSLNCPLIHSSTCIEKSAMEEIGGYRELPVGQDYRFFADISRRNWLAVIPEDLVLFRNHPNRLSHKSDDVQKKLAFDTLKDHMWEMTGFQWEIDDIRLLYGTGTGENVSIRKGVKSLNNWHRLWTKDGGLTAAEREELQEVYATTKKRFLRKNAKHQPVAFLLHSLDFFYPSRRFFV